MSTIDCFESKRRNLRHGHYGALVKMPSHLISLPGIAGAPSFGNGENKASRRYKNCGKPHCESGISGENNPRVTREYEITGVVGISSPLGLRRKIRFRTYALTAALN
jgi:hypothetical protein